MPEHYNSAAKKYKAAPKMKHSSPTEMNHAAPTKNLKKGYHGVKPNPPANMGSAYKMKNSVLHMGAKHGTPIHANYASPAKGNAFIGAKMAAEKAGKDTFTVDGKTFNVTGGGSPADMYGASPAKKDKEDGKGIIGAHGDIQTGEIVYTDNKKNLGYGESMPIDPSGEGDMTIFRNDPDNMRVTVTGYEEAKGNVKKGTYDALHGGHSITHHRDEIQSSNRPSVKKPKPLQNTNKKYKPS
jgi:hypothetical protein